MFNLNGRYQRLKIFALLAFLLIICGSVTMLLDSEAGDETNQKVEQENVIEEMKEEQLDTEELNFQIVRESEVRYDGGKTYYVYLEKGFVPETYKEDVKDLINKLVDENGERISVNISGNMEAIEGLYLEELGDDKFSDYTKEQWEEHSELLAVNIIASFDGEFDLGLYENELDFFPSATKDHSQVGQYVESMEYNPE